MNTLITSVCLCLFLFFGLLLYVPVNSYGHVGTVSSPNATFSCESLTKRFTMLLRADTFVCGWQQRKKEGKDQESIQSSTTPDQGYQWESDNVTVRHYKREPIGQPFPCRWPQSINKQLAWKHNKTRQNNINDPQMKHRLGTVSKIFYWRA